MQRDYRTYFEDMREAIRKIEKYTREDNLSKIIDKQKESKI